MDLVTFTSKKQTGLLLSQTGLCTLSSMDRRQTLLERLFWMAIFWLRYPECMKQLAQRSPQGCAQIAAEEADAAVAELRQRTERNGK